MKNYHTKSQVIAALFWKLMERGGTQGVKFIVQVILARLLLPKDYGIIALVVVFTSIASVFVQSGLNTALIQKEDADDVDFSSVFYLSISIACLVYIFLFFIAPIIATFYQEPQITLILRVLSITLFFGAFNSIQNAVVARNLHFKKLFYSSTGAILLSGTVGIFMAYKGLGVWALVGQQLTNQFLVTLILWSTVKWRPRLLFSFKKAKSLLSYGWKLLVSNLINTIYLDLRSLIIGKMYNHSMLGFYDRGQQFPLIIVLMLNGSIQSVILPVLASEQNNLLRVKSMVKRAIVTSSFFVFPMMVGLAVTAEPLVKLLLTDKWLPCVPFLQIFCVVYALMPIHTANLQAINALGRSDITLKLEIIKKCYEIAILGVTVFYGVYAIALGVIISGLISTVVNAYPNKKLLDYGFTEMWRDIMPSLLLSLVMGAIVYNIKWLGLPVMITLIFQICTGVILYVGMAWLFKLECFHYLLSTYKHVFENKKEG